MLQVCKVIVFTGSFSVDLRENTTRKELHPLELTSKVTTKFAYNGTSWGLHKERYCRIAIWTEQNVTN